MPFRVRPAWDFRCQTSAAQHVSLWIGHVFQPQFLSCVMNLLVCILKGRLDSVQEEQGCLHVHVTEGSDGMSGTCLPPGHAVV